MSTLFLFFSHIYNKQLNIINYGKKKINFRDKKR